MMETVQLSHVIADLKTATESALQGLLDTDKVLTPSEGISLFDTKNEIFLSYLQGLALRNLNVIQSLKDGGSSNGRRGGYE